MNQITQHNMPHPVTPSEWEIITTVAASGKKSGLGNEHVAQVKMLAALEHGLPLTSATQAVHVIDGKIALSPKAVWSKILRGPHLAKMEHFELYDNNGEFIGYKITLHRTNGMNFTYSFGRDSAIRAELVDKNNWRKYPHQMYWWRCLGFIIDVLFADYTMGELRASDLGTEVNENGEVLQSFNDASNGEWRLVEDEYAQSHAEQSAEPNYQTMLADLLSNIDPSEVMELCNGTIPSTIEEINEVIAKHQEQTQ